MEKLDEKKQEPLKTDLDDMKNDLDEMKKWADDSRKKQKSSLANTASEKSQNKTETKAKHEVKEKEMKKADVKEKQKPQTKAQAETKPKVQSKSKTVTKPKTETKSKTESKPKSETNKKSTAKKTGNKASASNQSKQKNKAQSTTKGAVKNNAFNQKLKDLKNQRAKKPSGKKGDGKTEHNYLLWATIAVIAIPCVILLYIVIGSRENSRTPVTGHRFKDALDPAITEENLNALKDSLKFDNADEVEITLKSATLRINIDTKDDLSQEEMKELVALAYDKVNEKLPIATYFTNKKNGDEIMKMYDLEISAYNVLPKDDAESKTKQIHLSRTKNAAAEEPVDDVLSSPKDEQSAEEILNPDTSNPPKQEAGNGQEEGE